MSETKVCTVFHIKFDRNYRVNFPDDMEYVCSTLNIDVYASNINEAIQKAWETVKLSPEYYEIIYASTDNYYHELYVNRRR